jgi:hypothetical protein
MHRRLAIALVAVALVAVASASACLNRDTIVGPANVTRITLGPALATSAYQPKGLPANWVGYCPVANPVSVTIVVGDAVQVVNQTDQPLSYMLGSTTPLEGIPPCGTGSKILPDLALSQASATQALSVVGCTDTASGQPLANVIVHH